MIQNTQYTRRNKKKVIFLIGPTAIGKTTLAIKLAKKINAEIISCDSMQIYKGMDVLSSKPSQKQRKLIKHHLLDIVGVDKEFNVAAYRRLALGAIKKIDAKGKIPLFVGGTGLYMSIVINGIFKDAGKDEDLRDKLYKDGERFGSVYLHDKLRKVDSTSASKIHPNDLKRIVRAIEVYKLTGKPISELKKKRGGITNKYDIIAFGMNKDRQRLYADINKRVELMFKKGLVNEVKRLVSCKLSLTCKQAIGINEILGFLDSNYDIGMAKELMKKNTRHYAKRQLTWFRKDKRIIWIDTEKKNILKEIIRCIGLGTDGTLRSE